MVDLIRGAISEVEAYDRVDITAVQPAGVLGRAVGDVIHLLAELVENATAFSPPDTRVTVTGAQVANGYALEITDQGLGMSAAALETANTRLASSPEFDPAQSARLGLFVVARLAARHGVRVRLRPSGARRGDRRGADPRRPGHHRAAGRPRPGHARRRVGRPGRRLARTARRGAVTRPRTRPPTAPSASTARARPAHRSADLGHPACRWARGGRRPPTSRRTSWTACPAGCDVVRRRRPTPVDSHRHAVAPLAGGGPPGDGGAPGRHGARTRHRVATPTAPSATSPDGPTGPAATVRPTRPTTPEPPTATERDA